MTTFTVPIRPRYGEVDSMGVVYHAQLLVYFDVGRTEYMRSRGLPYAALEARGFLLAVVEASIDYRRPSRYDEDLTLAVTLDDLRAATLVFTYELLGPEGGVRATGRTRLGCLNRSMRPTRLPADALAALTQGRTPGSTSSEDPPAPSRESAP